MSYRKVVELWESQGEETHGGENNGGARRVFCPASTKYSDKVGLSSWAGRLAFGSFWSGNGADPVRGGGVAGQVNAVDYITGMPDQRSEHFHVIDCGGYDRLRIVWDAECLSYEGLLFDYANIPNDTNNAWADGVFAVAYGADVVRDGLDYVNFPPALWANANDTLSGEGVGSNLGGMQILNDTGLPNGTNWAGANGFATPAGTAIYTHNASGGTLTQTTAQFAGGAVASKQYILQYQVTASTVAGGDMTLSAISSTTVTGLPRTVGTHQRVFTTAASAGNFVLTVTSSSGSMTIDNIFVQQDLRAGANRRPRPMFAAPNNGGFTESELFRSSSALAIRGHSIVPAAISDMSRFTGTKIPNGLPVAAVPSQQVGWGALQWGITQRLSTGAIYSRLPQAGDRYHFSMDIGIPTMSSPGTATPAVAGPTPSPHDLWITGLARVYFAMASVGVGFGTGSPEYLLSSPVGPATAPRQRIKGRLFAILSSLSGKPEDTDD